MNLASFQAFAQDKQIEGTGTEFIQPLDQDLPSEVLLPILFILFLVFVIINLIKYFLEYRIKNKLIDRGMAEQLSAYLLDKNVQEKQDEVVKLAIIFFGVGLGLLLTYLTSPINLHSLAIIAFCLGLSYLAYFFYLRK
ncbi:hypothetical protein D0X99_16675 [Algoriphagus lacus]|uniref:DUF6249 domain-containing protein n=2 Tax=Algoriphagus lacus TaxID=2056311 RepID=A0A418PND6_9BACT|nr:hypothetical protein D0X99_16675 [Algoriphagus lacus]